MPPLATLRIDTWGWCSHQCSMVSPGQCSLEMSSANCIRHTAQQLLPTHRPANTSTPMWRGREADVL
jgi:hypothetical protein